MKFMSINKPTHETRLPAGQVTIINGFGSVLSGQDVLPGFELDLKELKS